MIEIVCDSVWSDTFSFGILSAAAMTILVHPSTSRVLGLRER